MLDGDAVRRRRRHRAAARAAAASASISAAFFAPPPQTSTSSLAPAQCVGDRVRDRARRQRDERRLDVGRRDVATVEPRRQPLRVEQIAAGALRRQPGRSTAPRAAPSSSASSTRPVRAHAPSRSKPAPRWRACQRSSSTLPGPVSKPRTLTSLGGKSVMLAMPPILTTTGGSAPEERGVKGRHQRRTLAAGGDVAAPEIGDDGQAGPLGDARRVVELQRPAFVGTVAQRLAVHARRDHVLRREAGRSECGLDRVRVRVGQRVGGAHRARKLIVAGALQREQVRRRGPVRRERALPKAARRVPIASEQSRRRRRPRRPCWCRTSRRRRPRAWRRAASAG